MPILPMALSLVMGYASLYTRSSAVFGSASCKESSASAYGCFTKSAERQTLGRDGEARLHGWMTLTKISVRGPDLPLLFKLHEIWSVDS